MNKNVKHALTLTPSYILGFIFFWILTKHLTVQTKPPGLYLPLVITFAEIFFPILILNVIIIVLIIKKKEKYTIKTISLETEELEGLW